MDFTSEILVVDDNIGEIMWLLDLLNWRGYSVDHVGDERSARKKLEAVQTGDKLYALAIVDVMIATDDITNIIDDLDDRFYEESADSGIRLCRYARNELGILEDQLPIICFSARDDDDLKKELQALAIPLFSRTGEEIREYLVENLSRLA